MRKLAVYGQFAPVVQIVISDNCYTIICNTMPV